MKKILTFTLIAFMLICCLTGCGKRDPKYIGKWEASYMIISGQKYENMLGLPISAVFRFEIKGDGKLEWKSAVDNTIIENANDDTDITWKEKEKDVIQVKVSDRKGKEKSRTMDIKYIDDMLVIESDDSSINLVKVDEFTPIDTDALNAAAGVIQNFGVN